ncbi:MAG: metal-dependent transcriptional regulator [Bacteroidetes bacterium]|nr:metal-dependent transcriptional regulator [Bacteroidota bacterium]
MNETKITEEYLEAIWILLEKQGNIDDPLDLMRLKKYFGEQYSSTVVEKLQTEEFVVLDDSVITYTELGKGKSRQLIRAHRLAERLLYDVLGMRDYEVGACEFEHIIDTNLINGICTLLGHPRRCPDGMLIPEGVCCRNESGSQPNPTVSVMEMRTGEAGRVASVNADEDTQLHILEGLQIRPGSLIKVHQRSPSIVVECSGGSVAIDESIAANIHVWRLLGSEAEKAKQQAAHHIGRDQETSKRRMFRRRRDSDEGYDCGPNARDREKEGENTHGLGNNPGMNRRRRRNNS